MGPKRAQRQRASGEFGGNARNQLDTILGTPDLEARMREVFEKIGEELAENATAHSLPAGLVLTGGGSLLADAAELDGADQPRVNHCLTVPEPECTMSHSSPSNDRW